MIVLAGMIGVGKSSYAEMIARQLGTTAFYEGVDENPILDKFYDDPKTWAFSLQIYLINQRLKAIKEAAKNRNNVMDRSIYEDALFTEVIHQQGNLSKEDLDIYKELLDNMMEELSADCIKAPDLLVYLEADFDTILEHIKRRGRSYEQIDNDPELLEYYRTLHNAYAKWYDAYDRSAKMKISVDEFDIVAHPEYETKVMDKINTVLAEVRA